VTADHASIQAGNRKRGFPLAMITFAGTCGVKNNNQQSVSGIISGITITESRT
jgi:hypothetical protein